jgi:hypothetical protein
MANVTSFAFDKRKNTRGFEHENNFQEVNQQTSSTRFFFFFTFNSRLGLPSATHALDISFRKCSLTEHGINATTKQLQHSKGLLWQALPSVSQPRKCKLFTRTRSERDILLKRALSFLRRYGEPPTAVSGPCCRNTSQ